MQTRNDPLCIWADAVAKLQYAGHAGLVTHGNEGAPCPFDPIPQIRRNGIAEPLLFGEAIRAEPDSAPVGASFQTAPGHGTGVLCGRHGNTIGFGAREDGACQRV